MNETFRYEKNSKKAVMLPFSRKADHLHFLILRIPLQ